MNARQGSGHMNSNRAAPKVETPAGKNTNPVEIYLLSVISGRAGPVASLLRLLLACLAPLYCLGLNLYLLPYTLGIRKRYRLSVPVICIGNLTTGGTGKTPMTQTVCRMFLAHGFRPAVLSRGYGGENEYGCAVASDKDRVLLSAAQAGDEAFLLATSLPGVPVIVGKDRRVTGALAIQKFQPDVIVLDDGMQFWQLHRDLDIVLLNARKPFDNGYPFPRGLLREPKSHLRRAGIVVITGGEAATEHHITTAREAVRQITPDLPVFIAGLAPLALRVLADRVEYNIDWLDKKRVASVCAIGNPGAFEEMLEALSGGVDPRIRFRDHQAVSAVELESVFQRAQAAGASAVITTEKDAARMTFPLGTIPALALQVSMQIENESALAEMLFTLARTPLVSSR